MQREMLLASTFIELADSLVDDYDVVELLTGLADRYVTLLDVSAVGLMLVNPADELWPVASSSEEARLLDLFEIQAEEGPCVDCVRNGQPVVVPRLTDAEGRWPQFVPAAIGAGFRSAHALPMRLRGQTIGAVNVFGEDEGTLDAEDAALAQALADMATIGLLHHRAALAAQRVHEQLRSALESRVVIEQAKGVVAEQDGISPEQAFTRLRGHARNHNLALADLARAVVEGTLGAPNLDTV